MGFLRRAELAEAYGRIKRDAVGRTCSILIFVAATVDAICALKILTELLKGDFVPFKVVPVAGYDDIVQANDNFIQGQDEIKSVVMIDCGATVDLAELLSLSPELIVYLLDSHRPYSLFNIFGNSQLLILDDGFIEENMSDLELAFAATKFEEDKADDTDGEASSESESDIDDDEADEAREYKDNVHDENDEGQENSTVEASRGRQRLREEKQKTQQYREECRRRYLEYYGDGSWYGTSVARLFFDLSDALSRHCNDFLWFSILGVTSQQLMELSGSAAYEHELSWLRERCLQLNRDAVSSGSSGADGEHPPVPTGRDGRIRYEPEFRFMLTRHWSLFNSMLHSRYMATRLGVWREKGKRMLETFIAKMGVPLAQCKLDFQSMELELKESLPSRISKYAGEFGLDEVSFPSFVRDFGFVLRLSASDAVYALMALLEAPRAVSGASRQSSGALAPDAGSPIWIRNFYFAFDALDYQHIEKLRKGIQLAMKQQQIILVEASTILSHRLLRYGRRFRYVVLRNGSDEAWLAGHAFSLAKLALFIADATRNTRRGKLPLVVAAYSALDDTYFVVASGTATGLDNEHGDAVGATGGVMRNRFGLAFRRAAQTMRARVKHDGFDTSMIEVRAEDLKGFLQTLQSLPL